MRRLITQEHGVALPVAISVLLIVTILVGVAASVAITLTGAANRDARTKRALEAADAGLQVATYRLNMIAPTNGKCVTNAAVSPSGSQCPGYTGSLGNDAGYTFYTTTAMGASDSCAGFRVQASSSIVQRCVTSIGTANGVTRRVQARVAASDAVFPLPGILGLKSVTMGNSATINGVLGTNGPLTVGSPFDSTNASAQLGPSGTKNATFPDNKTTTRTPQQGPWVLGPYDFGNSATNNDNGRITSGLDVASNGVTYNAATRMLNVGNGSITLGGGATGTYNFCGLYGGPGSGATITVAANAKIKILIDSPDRPGSGCPTRAANSKSGVFDFGSGASFNNSSHDPTALQIYVYGYNDGSSVISMRNNADFYGTIYAPQSKLDSMNNTNFYGAIAVNEFETDNNFHFTFDPRAAFIQGRPVVVYYRTAWRECPPNPSDSADPKSGC